MNNFAVFGLLISCLLGKLNGVEIRELKVPQLVELSPEDILLDCDFEYEEDEKLQLDIKWYFNNEPSPFYQWVPAKMAKPQLIGDRFIKHIDLDHTVHLDEFKKHRALLIKQPTIELSGVYTCKVSSFVDEDVQQKEMIIYSPATSVTFKQQKLNGEQVNVSCAATGVYPQPQIKLLRGSYQLDDSEASVTTNESVGYYDIIVHRVVDHADLPQTTTFGCELTIPGTDYKVREESIYNHRGGRYSHHAAFASDSTSFFKYQLDLKLLLVVSIICPYLI